MALAPVTGFDSFTRAQTDSLGKSDSGHNWRSAMDATLSADPNVDVLTSGYARITMTGYVARSAHYLVAGGAQTTGTVTMRVKFNHYNDTQYAGVCLRTNAAGSTNGRFTGGRISAVSADGSVLLSIVDVHTDDVMYQRVTKARYDLPKGTWIWLKYQITTGGAYRLKAWAQGSAEPSTWDLSVAADNVTPTAAGYPGFFYGVSSTSGSITADIHTFYYETGSESEPALPIRDTWARTVEPGLGWSDSDHLWYGSFADDYETYAASGLGAVGSSTATVDTVPSSKRYGFIGPSSETMTGFASVRLNTSASRAGIGVRGTAAYTTGILSASAGYLLRLELTNAKLIREADDVTLATYTYPVAATTSDFINARLLANGSTIQGRVWFASQAEPATWHLNVTGEPVSSGRAFLFSQSANTNSGSATFAAPLLFNNVLTTATAIDAVSTATAVSPRTTVRVTAATTPTATLGATATASVLAFRPQAVLAALTMPSFEAIKPIKYADPAPVTVTSSVSLTTSAFQYKLTPSTAVSTGVLAAGAAISAAQTAPVLAGLTWGGLLFLAPTAMVAISATPTMTVLTVKAVPAPVSGQLIVRSGVTAEATPMTASMSNPALSGVTIRDVGLMPADLRGVLSAGMDFADPAPVTLTMATGEVGTRVQALLAPVNAVSQASHNGTFKWSPASLLTSVEASTEAVRLLIATDSANATATLPPPVTRALTLLPDAAASTVGMTSPVVTVRASRTELARSALVAFSPLTRVTPVSAVSTSASATFIQITNVWDTVVRRVVKDQSTAFLLSSDFPLSSINKIPPPASIALSAVSRLLAAADNPNLSAQGLDLWVFKPNELIAAEQINTNFRRIGDALGTNSTVEVLRPLVVGLGSARNGRVSALSDSYFETDDSGYLHIGYGAGQGKLQGRTVPVQLTPDDRHVGVLRLSGEGFAYYWLPKSKEDYSTFDNRLMFAVSPTQVFVSPNVGIVEVGQVATTSPTNTADSTPADSNPDWGAMFGGSNAGTAFPIGSIVRTTDNGLWVRREPGTAVDTHFDALTLGTRLTILSAPVVRDGYTWYRHRYLKDNVKKEGWSAGEYMALVTRGDGSDPDTTTTPPPTTRKVEQGRLMLTPLAAPYLLGSYTNFTNAAGLVVPVPAQWAQSDALDVVVIVDFAAISGGFVKLHGVGLSELTGFHTGQDTKDQQAYRETIPLHDRKALKLVVPKKVESLQLYVVGVWK